MLMVRLRLTTFNKGAQLIHDVMKYLNEEHCQGNAINNAKSRRAMENIADFTTPELAFSGMMTFVQLSEERDTWGHQFRLTDEDLKLWLINKSNNVLFNHVHYSIGQDKHMTFNECKRQLDNQIRVLIDASKLQKNKQKPIHTTILQNKT
jgi:hypothetical protein